MPDITLHYYPRFPYAEKIRLALGLKGLAYHSVIVPSWMPKPDLVPLTGGYRRTPVMQVGADVFCDTLVILQQIERMQPAPSLFPGGAAAMATALGWGLEQSLFLPAVGVTMAVLPALSRLIPWMDIASPRSAMAAQRTCRHRRRCRSRRGQIR